MAGYKRQPLFGQDRIVLFGNHHLASEPCRCRLITCIAYAVMAGREAAGRRDAEIERARALL